MNEWYETAKRPPTENDGVGEVLDVLCAGPAIGRGGWVYRGWVYRAIPWHMVAEFPSSYPFWQRITPPPPPGRPEEKAFKEWFTGYSGTSTEGQLAHDAFLAGVQWQKEQGK